MSISESLVKHLNLSANIQALEQRYIFDAGGVISGVEMAADLAAQAEADSLTKEANFFTETQNGFAEETQKFANSLMERNTGEALQSASKVIIIDSKLGEDRIATLKEAVGNKAELIVIDSHTDGLVQMAMQIDNMDGVRSVYVIANGAEGKLSLGASEIDFTDLNMSQQIALQSFTSSLGDNAELSILSKDFFNGFRGLVAYQALQNNVADIRVEASAIPALSTPTLSSAEVETAEIRPSSSQDDSEGRSVLFVDADLGSDEIETLKAGLAENVQLHLIHSKSDALSQMARHLSGQRNVGSVHILSHGSAGTLSLGNADIDFSALSESQQAALQDIGSRLADGADLLIYGCDFGAGEMGKAAVATLASLTGADIAASDDATGATRLGADWDLEVTAGLIEASLAFDSEAQQNFSVVLDNSVLGGKRLFHLDASDASSINGGGASTGDAITDWQSQAGTYAVDGNGARATVADNSADAPYPVTNYVSPTYDATKKAVVFNADRSNSLSYNYDGDTTVQEVILVGRTTHRDAWMGGHEKIPHLHNREDNPLIYWDKYAQVDTVYVGGGTYGETSANWSMNSKQIYSSIGSNLWVNQSDDRGNYPRSYAGDMHEYILLHTELNTAERSVLNNALSAKWGFDLIDQDGNSQDLYDEGSYNMDVAGILNNDTDSVDSNTSGGLTISNSGLTNGQSIFAGHNTDTSTTLPSGIPNLTAIGDREWKFDTTGASSANLTFNLADAGITTHTSGTYLLLKSDGSGGWTNAASASPSGGEVTFNGVTIDDGGVYRVGYDEPPVLETIALSQNFFKAGESATVTFTFSEAVQGFDVSDIDITAANGTISELAVTSDPKVWEATFTPAVDNDLVTGNTISVAAGAFQDLAGADNTAPKSSDNYSIDTRAQYNSILMDLGASRLFHLDASDESSINGGGASTGDTIDTITSQAGTYAGDANGARATGTPTYDATNKAVVFSDNPGSILRYFYDGDTTVKEVILVGKTTNVLAWMGGHNRNYHFHGYTNASVSNIYAGNAKVDTVYVGGKAYGETQALWSVDSKQTYNSVADNTFSLNQSYDRNRSNRTYAGDMHEYILLDTELNTAERSVLNNTLSAKWGFDLIDPTGQSRDYYDGDTSINGDYDYDVAGILHDGTDSVTSNTSGGLTIANLGLGSGQSIFAGHNTDASTTLPSGVEGIGDREWKFDTNGGASSADLTFNLAEAGITNDANAAYVLLKSDGSGGWTTVASELQSGGDVTFNDVAIDDGGVYRVGYNEPPVLNTITLSQNTFKAGESATVTFTFSEAVQGFDVNDITAANGTISDLKAVDVNDPTVWTATFTPAVDKDLVTVNTISVAAGAFQDLAGADNTAPKSSDNYSIDTKAPSLNIEISDTALKIGETAEVTFTFSEAVNDFAASDIVYDPNLGMLSGLAATANPKVWTATFAPTANLQNTSGAISVTTNKFQDLAGNDNKADASVDFTIDTKAPTLNITLSDTELTSGETATVTFTFSEAVSGFDASDIVYDTSAGAIKDFQEVGSDSKVWKATFTPYINIDDTSNIITVADNKFQDSMENTNKVSFSSPNYTIDTKAPFLRSIVLDDTEFKSGDTATVTFTFSEAVNNFDVNDIDITAANGTISNLTTSDSIVWTATFTPASGKEEASNVITVGATKYQDVDNIDNMVSFSSDNYSIDTKAPTLTIALSDSELSIGETATVTFTFSEAVSDFTADDIIADNGTITDFQEVGSDSKVWTVTFTPTTDIEDASNVISVADNKFQDLAGNDNTADASVNYSIDTIVPTLNSIVLDDTALKNGEAATVTFTFSEAVNDFDVNDIDITAANGTISNLTTSDSIVWTATFTPDPDIEVTSNTISVAKNDFQDLVGNTSTVGTSVPSGNYSIDTIAPVLDSITLSNDDGDIAIEDGDYLKKGETATVTFTFSEAVPNFDVNAINAFDGTISNLTTSDQKVWTATFEPTDDSFRALSSISVALQKFQDSAGNPNGDAEFSVNFKIDTKIPNAPTINDVTSDSTITKAEKDASGGVEISGTAEAGTTVTLSFKDGNDNELLTKEVVAVAGDTWAYSLIEADYTALGQGAVTLSAITEDQAGNVSDPSDVKTFAINTEGPILNSFTSTDGIYKAGDVITITANLNTDVKAGGKIIVTLDTGVDITLTTSADANTLTGTYTVAAGENSADLTITAYTIDGVQDSGNNPLVHAALPTDNIGNNSDIVIDGIVPTLVNIEISDTELSNSDTATVTFTFDEAVSGFDVNDITVENGDISGLSVTPDSKVWTATFTPYSEQEVATNTISVADGAFQDIAGNDNAASQSSDNFTIDTEAPSLTIALSDSDLTSGETATVTFTFSEAVSGFTADDITVNPSGAGTITALQQDGNDPKVWTATFTPKTDLEDALNTISVRSGKLEDSVGNVNSASISSNVFGIDTKVPTLDSIVLDDTALKIGDTAEVTFTFSEAVQGFDATDIIVDNGTISDPVAVDGSDPKVWTATFTPNSDLEDATNAIKVAGNRFQDLAGNESTDASPKEASYSIDTLAPFLNRIVLDDKELTGGDTAKVTFTFSEAVPDFEANDIIAENGTISGLVQDTTDPTVWTATFTPDANLASDTNKIRVQKSAFQDSVGNIRNDAAFVESRNYTVNTLVAGAPTISDIAVDNVINKDERDGGVTITGTAEIGEKVELSFVNNGDSNLSLTKELVTVDGNGDWTVTLTNTEIDSFLGQDDVTIRAIARDSLNNESAPSSKTITIDTEAPTLNNIVLDNSQPIKGETTVTFTFDEAVSDFTTNDISASNGTISDLVTSDSTVWTATFTPDANLASDTNTISVAAGVFQDIAGNTGEGTASVSSNNYSIDTEAATLEGIVLDDAELGIGDTPTVTFTFSEAVSGFEANDIIVDNGTISGLVTSDSIVWTATFTPDANLESDTNKIRVQRSAFQDSFGNIKNDVTFVESGNYTVNTLAEGAPTINAVATDNEINKADRDAVGGVTITGTAEAVSTVTLSFKDENGDELLTKEVVAVAGDTWAYSLIEADYTALGQGAVTISAVSSGKPDAPSNKTITIDTEAPTLNITLDNSQPIKGETTVTFTFDEAVSDFDANAISASNGTISDLVTSDSKVWTATFTPNSDLEETTNTISVAAGVFQDIAGNTGEGTTPVSSNNYSIDTQAPDAPTISVVAGDNVINIAEWDTSAGVEITGTAEAGSDVTLTFGASDSETFSAGSGDWSYTLDKAKIDELGQGEVTINVTAKDSAGNVSEATEKMFAIDTKVPELQSITLSNDDGDIAIAKDDYLKKGETATVTFTFSEEVPNFVKSDVSVQNGEISDPVQDTSNPTVWTATFTPAVNQDLVASNTISVGAFQDSAGNPNTDAQSSVDFQIDTLAPVVPTINNVTTDNIITKEEKNASGGVEISGTAEDGTTVTLILGQDSSGADITRTLTAGATGWSYTLNDADYTALGQGAVRLSVIAKDQAGNESPVAEKTITINTEGPKIESFTSTDGNYKAGDEVIITANLNKPVKADGEIVVTLNTGVEITLTTLADADTLSGTYTVAENHNSADLAITAYTIDGVQDSGGNRLVQVDLPAINIGSHSDIVIDTIVPALEGIEISDSELSSGETAEVTFTFSEAVQGFEATDIIVDNGTISDPVAVDGSDPKVWTATFTPTEDVDNKLNSIKVAGNTFQDLAGNESTDTNTKEVSYSIDTVAPFLNRIVLDDKELTGGDTAKVTFTFSEAVSDFTADDIIVENGTISGLVQDTTDPKVWTATFTPDANLASDTNKIRVQKSAFQDSVGNIRNDAAFVESRNYTVNTLVAGAPTINAVATDNEINKAERDGGVTITGTAEANSTVTLSFKDGNGDALSLTKELVTVDGNGDWTVTLNSAEIDSLGQDDVTLSAVSSGKPEAPSSKMITIDTEAPTLNEIVLDNSQPIKGETTVTFTFSEAVSDFTTNDISASNGTISDLVTSDSTVWTATFTPDANLASDTNTISVAAGVFQDIAGNTGEGTTSVSSNNYSIDTEAATLEGIVLDDAELGIGDTPTVTFTFSEAVSGFEANDIIVDNGTISGLVTSDSKVWTATFTPDANLASDTNKIRVQRSAFQDSFGNIKNDATFVESGNYTVNTLAAGAPMISDITGDNEINKADRDAGVTITGTAEIGETVTLSFKDGNGDALSLITVSNPADGNGDWTVTLSSAETDSLGQGDVTIRAIARDSLNNESAPSSKTITIDTEAPTLNITLDNSQPIKEDTIVTFTFSEAVSGFDANAISASNGTISDLVTSDSKVWTATFTPNSDLEETTNTISVAAGVFQDIAGNTGEGTASVSSANYSIDTLAPDAPTISVVAGDNVINLAEWDTSAGVEITGTAEVGSDVTLSFGAGDSETFSAGLGNWSYILDKAKIDELGQGEVTINVTAKDQAGNVSEATEKMFAIDTKVPELQSIISDKSSLKIGETAEVTFTFSEAVQGFVKGDVSVQNGEISDPVQDTSNPKVWTAIFTPASDKEVTSNTISVVGTFQDLAGNDNTASESSNNYSIDTLAPDAPTINDVTADNIISKGEKEANEGVISGTAEIGETVTLSFKDGDGIELLTKEVVAVAGDTWTYSLIDADYTALGQGAVTLRVTAKDQAGNESPVAEKTVTIDTEVPTIEGFTTNKADGSYSVGEDITITANMSEPVKAGGNIIVTLNTGVDITLTTSADADTLSGTYTVAAGQDTTDLTITAYTIDGVQDLGNNALVHAALPLDNIGSGTAIVIDTKAPDVLASMNLPTELDDGKITLDERSAGVTFNPTLATAEANESTVTVAFGGTNKTVAIPAGETTIPVSFALNEIDFGEGVVSYTFTDSVGNSVTQTSDNVLVEAPVVAKSEKPSNTTSSAIVENSTGQFAQSADGNVETPVFISETLSALDEEVEDDTDLMDEVNKLSGDVRYITRDMDTSRTIEDSEAAALNPLRVDLSASNENRDFDAGVTSSPLSALLLELFGGDDTLDVETAPEFIEQLAQLNEADFNSQLQTEEGRLNRMKILKAASV